MNTRYRDSIAGGEGDSFARRRPTLRTVAPVSPACRPGKGDVRDRALAFAGVRRPDMSPLSPTTKG
ncbi:MAG: hypothetical protein M0038_02350, partial [Pseudomonadota bacterium]|nr:hypothetical protein [Pseudomonadota bacterium]